MTSPTRAKVSKRQASHFIHLIRLQAVDFLLGHGFRMEAPFLRGVPYLSWEEESKARAATAANHEMPDIAISPADTENIQLLQRARLEIDAWIQRKEVSQI